MGKRLALEIFMVTFIGLMLGLIGPFGTFEFPAGMRAAYWVTFGLVGYAIFRPLGIVGAWLSDALGMSRIIGVGLAQAIASMPMALIVAFLIKRFDLSAALHWSGLPTLYFQVWLIGFLTHGFFVLVFRNRETPVVQPAPTPMGEAAPEPATNTPRFEDRLPPGFGRLLALAGEDHYVRAIGESREAMILMRLRDAMTELTGVDGLQVHRSWWVARAAIVRVDRRDRAATLTLSNNREIPVAREKMASLRAAGWLK